MPWEILGLDHATATEKDVRRAYSKLLKKHRPDQDPSGFQKIHTAYQQAKSIIANRRVYPKISNIHEPEETVFEVRETPAEIAVETDDDETAPNRPESFVSMSRQIQPDPLYEALVSFRNSVNARNDFQSVSEANRLLELSIEYPENADVIDKALADFASEVDLTRCEAFTVQTFLRFVEHERIDAADALIFQLSQANAFERLKDFADALLKAQERFCHASAASIAISLGTALVYYHAFTVERLANFAYSQLPPSQREYRLGQLNYLFPYARALRYLDLKDRLRWRAIIAGENELDLSKKEDQRFLKRSGKHMADGGDILNPYLENAEWVIFNNAYAKSQYRTAESKAKENSGSPNWGCLIILALWVLIKIMSTLGR